MSKRFPVRLIAALAIIAFTALVAYQKWGTRDNDPRSAMLAAMPAAASTILFADFTSLRQSPFAAQLYSWAPRTQIDPDYAQFLHDTGFDYERDLDRIAVAMIGHAPDTSTFAIAEGRFDRKKIVVYASQFGTPDNRGGHEVFSVPLGPPSPNANQTSATQPSQASPNATSSQPRTARKISFTFLADNRIALTTNPDPATIASAPASGWDANQWRERFERLAGSPVFAVIRQDATPGTILAARAPGGLQSPQLSSLLDQLQWITVAGKPEGNLLRVAAEGECPSDPCSRQLSDMLSGILVLAQSGLNGPQIRQQLDPQAREAFLEILKSADVSRIDRGETKSVRLLLDITPKFLTAARDTVHTAPKLPARK
jgi:hypothetical protein